MYQNAPSISYLTFPKLNSIALFSFYYISFEILMSSQQIQPNGIRVDSESSFAKLVSSTFSGPVIAIDLDDVLSQTNEAISQWYNENYPGAKMHPSNFYYYYYWKNPYWGTPDETFKKMDIFYSTTRIHAARPVPEALEGVQALRNMGFRLIIVTARLKNMHKDSWEWVDRHFPGM